MKRTGIIALALALFSGCAQNGYLGGDPLPESLGCAITFNGNSAPVTKAVSGADAATLLGGSFVVYGSKNAGTAYHTVFDGYNVKWVDNAPGVAQGGTWEYVGQQDSENDIQGAKYWDYNTQHYTFIAFSKGGGNAIFSAANPANIGTTSPIYTITGQPNDEQLYPIYLAEPVRVNKANYGKAPVSISFRPFRTKARFGIYETIPGYSVENVCFYHTSTIGAIGGDYPVIITDDEFLPSKGEFVYSVYSSGADGHLTVQCAPTDGVRYKSNIALDTIAYSNDGMLGTTSADASYFLDSLGNSYIDVLPTGDNSGKLGIRVDFTLVPLDGSDSHKVTVKGAMAFIPEEFIRWQPGYAYTYLFKITEAADGLYPITFDAEEYLASDPLDTETIEGGISITTYQKGSAMDESGAYNTTDNIYVTVGNFHQLQKNNVIDSCYIRLYKVSGSQTVTETDVQNCLENGSFDPATVTYTITDALSHTLSLTDVTGNISIMSNFPADDTPDSNMPDHSKAIACISGQEQGTYVFVYRPNAYQQASYNTMSTGAVYYEYDYEYEDGYVFELVRHKSDGTELYDYDAPAPAKDLMLSEESCLCSDNYTGVNRTTSSQYLSYGIAYYYKEKNSHGIQVYREFIPQGSCRDYLNQNDNEGKPLIYYRKKQAVYFEHYQPGYTIQSGENYWKQISDVDIHGRSYIGYAEGNEYPIVITESNKNDYVYAKKNRERFSDDPFEVVTSKNNYILKPGEWYLCVDGLDNFRDDDGTFDDSISIYIQEYQAPEDEETALMCLFGDTEDGFEYGLFYDLGGDGPGLYYPWLYTDDEYNTLAPGNYLCYSAGKMNPFIADGTENPDSVDNLFGMGASWSVYLDSGENKSYYKVIEVR